MAIPSVGAELRARLSTTEDHPDFGTAEGIHCVEEQLAARRPTRQPKVVTTWIRRDGERVQASGEELHEYLAVPSEPVPVAKELVPEKRKWGRPKYVPHFPKVAEVRACGMIAEKAKAQHEVLEYWAWNYARAAQPSIGRSFMLTADLSHGVAEHQHVTVDYARRKVLAATRYFHHDSYGRSWTHGWERVARSFGCSSTDNRHWQVVKTQDLQTRTGRQAQAEAVATPHGRLIKRRELARRLSAAESTLRSHIKRFNTCKPVYHVGNMMPMWSFMTLRQRHRVVDHLARVGLYFGQGQNILKRLANSYFSNMRCKMPVIATSQIRILSW